MKMASEQLIAAPRQRVWEALNDPEILRASIPGCQSLDKEAEDRFTATVEVKAGPIGARFKGAVSLTELQPPNGYTLNFQGNGGIAGSVKGSAKLRLREDAGGTFIVYEVDAQVGGRMTQLGGPIIDATAKQLAGRFFSRFGDIVGGAGQAGPDLANPDRTRLASSPASTGAPAKVAASRASVSRSAPITWILAIVVAVMTGFLVGRSEGNGAADWAGLAIGLLVVVVAGAAFEYGRRSASPVVMLDSAGLRRLLDGVKE
jgi:uncharacterized protein